MSPRSDEYLTMSRRQLAEARHSLGGGFAAGAATTAYYAIFNAARAALSEADINAKTHAGVWTRFGELYVKPGRISGELGRMGTATQQRRQQVAYELDHVTAEEAEALIADAERFVAAIEDVLAE